ncbi:MAG: sn-glycerol-1-phosphate dehydrogenase [Spirochaetaceae bacterium]
MVSTSASNELETFLKDSSFTNCTVVSDAQTRVAAGADIASRAARAGLSVREIVLEEGEVIADEVRLIEILRQTSPGDDLFIAAGSGTITDMTRFISLKLGVPFISCPTAASVDGFTSIGAPLVLKGIKQTVIAQAPLAMFADTDVLSAAPPEMTAAGYGDIIGKITSLADWHIGHLLWDEPYDESIARRTRNAIDRCVEHRHEIRQRTSAGVEVLMHALVETGLCLVDFGESRPASGAEHHLSHFWEMQLLRDGRPAILHGAKVGVATVIIARLYERLRSISRDGLTERIASVHLPGLSAERDAVHAAYGRYAEQLMKSNDFLELDEERVRDIRERIVKHWAEIQDIAATVPSADEVAGLLRDAGAPTESSELGLSPELENAAFRFAHYLRNRFTSVKLARFLGIHS